MRMLKQIILEASGNLANAKQRTLLALIGIVIGTGSVIAMINIGTIVQEEALRQFRELGTNIMNVKPATTQAAGFVLADVLALPQKVPLVEMVGPAALAGGTAVVHGRSAALSVIGTTPASPISPNCRRRRAGSCRPSTITNPTPSSERSSAGIFPATPSR